MQMTVGKGLVRGAAAVTVVVAALVGLSPAAHAAASLPAHSVGGIQDLVAWDSSGPGICIWDPGSVFASPGTVLGSYEWVYATTIVSWQGMDGRWYARSAAAWDHAKTTPYGLISRWFEPSQPVGSMWSSLIRPDNCVHGLVHAARYRVYQQLYWGNSGLSSLDYLGTKVV